MELGAIPISLRGRRKSAWMPTRKVYAREVVAKALNWPYADWPALAWALSNCLKREDYSQAVEVLKTMEEHFDESTVGQVDLKKYPDFLESIEYMEWSAGKSVREP